MHFIVHSSTGQPGLIQEQHTSHPEAANPIWRRSCDLIALSSALFTFFAQLARHSTSLGTAGERHLIPQIIPTWMIWAASHMTSQAYYFSLTPNTGSESLHAPRFIPLWTPLNHSYNKWLLLCDACTLQYRHKHFYILHFVCS